MSSASVELELKLDSDELLDELNELELCELVLDEDSLDELELDDEDRLLELLLDDEEELELLRELELELDD